MVSRYRTSDGDMLDAICAAELGSAALVAQVLDINPGLAARGPVYEAGIVIQLPDNAAAPVEDGQIRLWGQT